MATALGWSGEVESARDAAQEAFALAFAHLRELENASAFPAWFLRLVRTACHRQCRRRAVVTLPLEQVAVDDAADPAQIVVSRREAERVRAAVEALPEGERVVIALHYLAGLTYPEIATLLGIGLSAVRKRAHVARWRSKELLPIAVLPFQRCRARPCGNSPRIERQQVDRLTLQPAAGLGGKAVREVDGHLAAQGLLEFAA